MTMFRILGSVMASIGSLRYGVRFVLHGPASAELSGDNRRYLSAHSETVRFSGGLKPLKILWKHFSVLLFINIIRLFALWEQICRPSLAFADVGFIFIRSILVMREFYQELIALLTDQI